MVRSLRCGEPGLGKSRLFYEFIHSHRTQGWLIVESGSVSYGKATPYLPLIDLLKAYFKIHDRDNQREIREKVTGKLLTLDESLKPTLPAFLALLDIPVDDQQWQALDPPQKRQRTLDACKRLLFRESQAQPLLLVFEDLHWIDAETQTLLDSLVESLPTARLLLLVNYRPEYQHGWGSKTFYSQLRLDPLPAESAEELLQSLLGNDPSLQPLKQLLIARTEGNPFFLEESVRTLFETKVIEGERGVFRVAKSVESIQVPATVQAVLAARIDRLPAEDKRLFSPPRSLARMCPLFCSKPLRIYPRRTCAAASRTSRPASFSMRRVFSPSSNTPSSTRSRTRSPTAACFRNGGARFTLVSSKRLRNSIRTGWPNRPSCSPITRFAASFGEGGYLPA